MAAPAAADERQHVTVPCSADDGYAVVVAADSGGAAAWELGNKGHSAPAGAADYAIGSFEGPGQFSATSTGITAAEHLATASLSWDSSLSWLLKKFKTRALVSMWLHTNAVAYYTVLYNLLSYPVILISCLSTAAIFSQTSSTATINVLINYLTGAASILSAMLVAIARQMRPAEMAEKHATACKRYERLIREIEITLTMPIAARNRPDIVVDRVQRELDAIGELVADPPAWVVWMFEKRRGTTLEEMMYGSELLEMTVEGVRTSSCIKLATAGKAASTSTAAAAAAAAPTTQPQSPTRAGASVMQGPVLTAGQTGALRSPLTSAGRYGSRSRVVPLTSLEDHGHTDAPQASQGALA